MHTITSPSRHQEHDLVRFPTRPNIVAVAAVPGVGKTTACRAFGWVDSDSLTEQFPELKHANWPTYWHALHAWTLQFREPTVICFPSGSDVDAVGAWSSQAFVVSIQKTAHIRQMTKRGFTALETTQCLAEADLLTAWAEVRSIPVVASFNEAHDRIVPIIKRILNSIPPRA